MGEIWHGYAELLTDPAHTAVEFTFVLLDVLIIDAVRRRWRKHLKREHLAIDAEHGVEDHGQTRGTRVEYAGTPSTAEQLERAAIVRRKLWERSEAFRPWDHSLEREADEAWLRDTLGVEHSDA